MPTATHIVVLDDDQAVSAFIASAANNLGLTCTATTNADDFLSALSPDVDLVVIDLVMPETDGIEILRLLGRTACKANVILISGLGKRVLQTATRLAQTLGLSIVGHLQKPFRLRELELLLRSPVSGAEAVTGSAKEEPLPDSDIREAIRGESLLLHYQPQIEVTTGALRGVEALVRLQHPDQGLVYPDRFIGRTEELGLIDELTWAVIRKGFAELSLFADEAGSCPAIAFNVSVQSLHDLSFPDKFVALASRCGVWPQDTTLEVTESGLLRELGSSLDVLTRLRMKQVQISVDDFGTGYSMLQQLQQIPATEIKIDRSFVQKLPESRSDGVMVAKTIEIGHELGLKVIAEGVETDRQLEFLRSHQCDEVQGYLLCRPLAAPDLVNWIARRVPDQRR